MKFMLNGALTIGTLDGANVEIREEVGDDNIFIFGLKSDDVINLQNNGGYNPWFVYNMNQDVRKALIQLINGTLDEDTELFREIYEVLLNGFGGSRADEYFILQDFEDYARAQADIDAAYKDKKKWAKMAVLNTAKSGKFSSDRTIKEYADEIWEVKPVEINM